MKDGADTELAKLQAWFGRAISRPLPKDYADNPLAVSLPELEKEADARLNGKGGLSGFGRLGIYNQQYWFRLVGIMQSEYACAVHYLGLGAFNQWVVRYLEAHPPASPFLAELDAGFPAFLEERYREPDREVALQVVAYDRALSKAFDAAPGAPLSAADLSAPERLLNARLRLAPHVTPLHVDWDLASYRALCRADESLEGKFTLEPGRADWVIYRDADLEIQKEEVSRTALAVLGEFREPISLTGAFERLAGRLSESEMVELEKGIGGWFQAWTARGWLCL